MIYVSDEEAPSVRPAEAGSEAPRQQTSRVPPLEETPSREATRGDLRLAREKPRRMECLLSGVAKEESDEDQCHPADEATCEQRCS